MVVQRLSLTVEGLKDAGGGSSVPGGEKTRVFSPINRVVQIPKDWESVLSKSGGSRRMHCKAVVRPFAN